VSGAIVVDAVAADVVVDVLEVEEVEGWPAERFGMRWIVPARAVADEEEVAAAVAVAEAVAAAAAVGSVVLAAVVVAVSERVARLARVRVGCARA
jgi:hypothetical protein